MLEFDATLLDSNECHLHYCDVRHSLKGNFMKVLKLLHEPSNSCSEVFYQFHEPSKFVHDSSKTT